MDKMEVLPNETETKADESMNPRNSVQVYREVLGLNPDTRLPSYKQLPEEFILPFVFQGNICSAILDSSASGKELDRIGYWKERKKQIEWSKVRIGGRMTTSLSGGLADFMRPEKTALVYWHIHSSGRNYIRTGFSLDDFAGAVAFPQRGLIALLGTSFGIDALLKTAESVQRNPSPIRGFRRIYSAYERSNSSGKIGIREMAERETVGYYSCTFDKRSLDKPYEGVVRLKKVRPFG